MKRITKRSLAWLASLMLLVSLLAGVIVLPVQAATVNYVRSGSYVYNWGQREELATFLSPMAEEFYEENNVVYATLASLSGASSTSDVPDSALYEALHTLMYDNLTNPTSYAGTRDLYRYTDCQNSAKTDSSISSFYSGTSIGPDWDSGSTWNREHVWPNSRSTSGSSYTDREEDIMMLRPTAVKENSSRSNTPYGEGSSYYDPNGESNGTYNLRGDVSRVILYVYTCWGGSDEHDGAYDYLWGSSGVMESKDVLLKWIEEDPVDTWELGRNDSVEAITGTRNVFVDYPELAFLLFDEEVPADYDSPSGEGTTGGCDHNYVGRVTTAVTCEQDGVKTYTCSVCGHSYTEAIAAVGHVYTAACATACNVCGAERTLTAGGEETITFDDAKTQRVSFSTASQVWQNGNLTVTNNKASSSNNVADYTNPVRLYKSSEIIIAYPGMTSLTISAPTGTYGTPWGTTLTAAGLEYEVNSGVYTVTFITPVDSISLTASAQVRAYSITAVGAIAVAEHTYDNACDADCNVCGATRTPADHVYTSQVTTAATCGANGVMTYTCSVCGDSYTEAILATGEHTYDNACDADCNVCGGTRQVGDHTYDNANDTTCNECGAVRQIAAQVLSYGGSSISEDVNGLAFFFSVNVTGAQMQNNYQYVSNSAAVTPFVGGVSYTVVRMGAVVSNGVSSVDIEAKYLWDVAEDECSFAVRLIDIPDDQLDREITARPYYVYVVDGEEVVVYGDAVSKTYNEAAQ